MAKATEEALAKAEAGKTRATNRANKAEAELEAEKKKGRDKKKKDKAERNHIFVRLVSEFTGTAGNVGGQYVGARFLGPKRRIFKKVPLTYGGAGQIVGTVGKMATVGVEDTWAEPVIATVAEFGKGLFAVDVVSKGLEMRAEAQAKKGKDN